LRVVIFNSHEHKRNGAYIVGHRNAASYEGDFSRRRFAASWTWWTAEHKLSQLRVSSPNILHLGLLAALSHNPSSVIRSGGMSRYVFPLGVAPAHPSSPPTKLHVCTLCCCTLLLPFSPRLPRSSSISGIRLSPFDDPLRRAGLSNPITTSYSVLVNVSRSARLSHRVRCPLKEVLPSSANRSLGPLLFRRRRARADALVSRPFRGRGSLFG
jgi:hypothetical protein